MPPIGRTAPLRPRHSGAIAPDEDRPRERQVQIATAVDMVLQTTARHQGDAQPGEPRKSPPESACSLVAKALAKVDMSHERN